MSRQIEAFSETQIWAHKHLIHFTAALLLTGFMLTYPQLLGWLAYVLAAPVELVGKALGLSIAGYSAYSLGLQVARIIHRLAGIGLVFVALVVFFREIWHPGKWYIWPEGGLGEAIRNMVRFYIHKEPARFSKYNLGQKLWAWAVIIGVPLMAVTGFILWFKSLFPLGVVEAAHMIHLVGAILAALGLMVHVYAALGIPEHWPAVRAMFRTGTLPEEYVKEHHPAWYEKIAGKAPGEKGGEKA